MSPETILQKYWGYTSFRKNQKSIIQSIIDGHDTLALMATGGGKSICYQVPALMTDGVTLVISPLIALMKDQVERLKERGIFAEAIYSGMHPSAVDRILDNAIYGKIKLLYLSPERLKSEMAIARIQRMKVNLIAVDEAHCISQWGFDFRPSYLEIKDIREWHPTSPILALTATATARVIEDIEDQLELRQAQIFKSSFARSNIALSTTQAESKEHLLAKLCSDHQITRIVYANTRKQTKIFSDHLKRLGLQSDFYHAGLSTKERLRKQKAWTEGKISTIVCTNAFGMGIDKADVRQVIHLHIPGTIESYFQEAGRAGRDGQDAEAVLLYYQRDIDKLSTSIELSFPPMTTLRKVYQSLANFLNLAIGSGKNESFDFDLTKFCQAYNLEVLEAYHSLNVLEKEGWLTLSEGYSRPSSLRFKIPGNQVYQYQINDSKGSELIAVLLRTYQNIGTQFTHIDEAFLSKQLGCSQDEIVRQIQHLAFESLLEYQPRSNHPQITLLRERVAAKNLTIDLKSYKLRKKRKLIAAKAITSYLKTTSCRQQYILRYFGEYGGKPCGICDRCQRETSPDGNVNEIIDLILNDFKSRSFQKQELLALQYPKSIVDDALNHLLDEGKLDIKGNSFNWR